MEFNQDAALFIAVDFATHEKAMEAVVFLCKNDRLTGEYIANDWPTDASLNDLYAFQDKVKAAKEKIDAQRIQ